MSSELYQQALSLYRGNDLAAAEELCNTVLRATPEHADTLHLLGLVCLRGGLPERAAHLIRVSLARNPHQPLALCNLGIAQLQSDRLHDALVSFEDALRLAPDTVLAVYNRANVLQALDRHEEAIVGYEHALALNPGFFEALNNRGHSLLSVGRLDEARESFERALALLPDNPQALSNHRLSLQRQADELHRLGLNAVQSGETLQAVAYFEAAIAANPDQAAAHCNLGTAWLDLKRPGEALGCFERALQLAPGYMLARYNHGTALFELRRFAEALVSLEAVLRVDPRHVNALVNHGSALRELQQNDAALISLERALALAPELKYLAGAVAYLRLQQCDWTDYETRRAEIRTDVMQGKAVDAPFSFLSLSDRAAEQRQCAEVFVREQGARPPAETSRGQHRVGERPADRRVRVAYVSRDFREHAVSYLMAGVLEQHDRSRFEIVGVSLRADESSPMGERVRRACDHFLSLSTLSDEHIADQIRELQVDILVDLVGFTEGVRPGILASRPAPIQVNYLGYPGTMAAPYMDYVLADEFVIPPDQRQHYDEQVVYLPECFQANDDRRPIEYSLTRAQCGLPESALVLCCFNNTFKLSPPFFDIWLGILQQRPQCVLWLLADRSIVQQNLCAYAAARGIRAERLVFAARLPYPRHLGRLALADLFLDTLPFNAGTTASDALWAGVPVLTCSGEALAARMAGSLLNAMSLPELITRSLSEYEQRALELTDGAGRVPGYTTEQLHALRERLAQQRTRAPVFNTPRFTRHLERAYLHMHDLHRRGLSPQSFRVQALD